MAIYELIEWEVVPGKMEELLKLEQPFQAYVRSSGGKPIGGFTTGVGDTSRLMAVVAYDDLGQFGQGLQTAQQNPDLQKLMQASAGLFTDVKTSILLPTPASALQ
jgi:hypothetical protein